MKITLALLALLVPAAAPAFAADPVAVSTAAAVKKWKDSAEVSFVNTNGNSRTQTTAGKELFSYDFDPLTRLEMEGGGLSARSQGQETAEQYNAGEKLQSKYDEHDYIFEKYRWDKNRFAGIKDRQEASIGLGRELWKTAKDLLEAEAAPGYLNEDRIGAKRESVATGRAFVKYSHDFTATSKFCQGVEYLQSLADRRASWINTETDLTTSLSAHFSVKTSFAWHRNTQPPPSFQKDDEITSFALIASY